MRSVRGDCSRSARTNDKEDAGWESKSEQSVKKNHKVCFKKRERIRFCLDGPFWLLPLSFTRPRRSKYSISNSLCCPFFFIYLRDVSFLPVDSLFIVYSFSDQILYGPAVLSPYSYLDVALHIRDTREPFFYRTAVFGEKLLSSSSKETRSSFRIRYDGLDYKSQLQS